MPSRDEGWDLAFGDLAIAHDLEQFHKAARYVDERFADQPEYWKRWATREVFLEWGGRRIEELPIPEQSRYRGR